MGIPRRHIRVGRCRERSADRRPEASRSVVAASGGTHAISSVAWIVFVSGVPCNDISKVRVRLQPVAISTGDVADAVTAPYVEVPPGRYCPGAAASFTLGAAVLFGVSGDGS